MTRPVATEERTENERTYRGQRDVGIVVGFAEDGRQQETIQDDHREGPASRRRHRDARVQRRIENFADRQFICTYRRREFARDKADAARVLDPYRKDHHLENGKWRSMSRRAHRGAQFTAPTE